MQSDSDSERVRGCFDVIADYVFKVSPLPRSFDCRIAQCLRWSRTPNGSSVGTLSSNIVRGIISEWIRLPLSYVGYARAPIQTF